MTDQIEIVDGKVKITKTITNEIVGEYTEAEIIQMIADYQSQIDYIQNLINEKQTMLEALYAAK